MDANTLKKANDLKALIDIFDGILLDPIDVRIKGVSIQTKVDKMDVKRCVELPREVCEEMRELLVKWRKKYIKDFGDL